MIPGFVEDLPGEHRPRGSGGGVGGGGARGRGTPGSLRYPRARRGRGPRYPKLGRARRSPRPRTARPVAVAPLADTVTAARAEGRRGGSAAFRRIGEPSGGGGRDGPRVRSSVQGRRGHYRPRGSLRRYWVVAGADGSQTLLEEVAAVDRACPVAPEDASPSLSSTGEPPPEVGPSRREPRASADLGFGILDPFLGTGGAARRGRVVRRAPLRHRPRLHDGAGRPPEPRVPRRDGGGAPRRRRCGTSVSAIARGRSPRILTDPPYGRASSTGGEDSSTLVAEVVERWCGSLAPDGRLVLIVPAGGPPLDVLGAPRFRIPVRVHRSLTRSSRLDEGTAIVRRSSH